MELTESKLILLESNLEIMYKCFQDLDKLWNSPEPEELDISYSALKGNFITHFDRAFGTIKLARGEIPCGTWVSNGFRRRAFLSKKQQEELIKLQEECGSNEIDEKLTSYISKEDYERIRNDIENGK